jgi:phage gp16-like protein
MGTISRKQIQLIHIAKNELGLDEDIYRDMLFEFYDTRSSKDLSYSQATDLIERFKGFGFKIRSKKVPDNIIHMTTPKQRSLIDILSKRFKWKESKGFSLWLQSQNEKGFIKSVSLNESTDASWVIEKLKLMTKTTTQNISNRENPYAIG